MGRLVTLSDAAVEIRRIKRRASARRIALLVQSGAVSADDYRVAFDGETDAVVDAALLLALRHREASRPVGPGTACVRGIVELQEDTGKWAARAGSVFSKGFEFATADEAVEWLDEAVAEFVRSQFERDDYEYDYYLQIGIVETQLTCSSTLPHDDAGYCEVCWAVQKGYRETWDTPRRAIDEVTVDGEMVGTRGVAG